MSAPLKVIQYVQAVCYQDKFSLDIMTFEDWTDWLSQNVRMQLPLYAVYNPRPEQVSKHVQFQCVFPSAESQMVQYKCVLWHNLRKHCPEG